MIDKLRTNPEDLVDLDDLRADLFKDAAQDKKEQAHRPVFAPLQNIRNRIDLRRDEMRQNMPSNRAETEEKRQKEAAEGNTNTENTDTSSSTDTQVNTEPQAVRTERHNIPISSTWNALTRHLDNLQARRQERRNQRGQTPEHTQHTPNTPEAIPPVEPGIQNAFRRAGERVIQRVNQAADRFRKSNVDMQNAANDMDVKPEDIDEEAINILQEEHLTLRGQMGEAARERDNDILAAIDELRRRGRGYNEDPTRLHQATDNLAEMRRQSLKKAQDHAKATKEHAGKIFNDGLKHIAQGLALTFMGVGETAFHTANTVVRPVRVVANVGDAALAEGGRAVGGVARVVENAGHLATGAVDQVTAEIVARAMEDAYQTPEVQRVLQKSAQEQNAQYALTIRRQAEQLNMQDEQLKAQKAQLGEIQNQLANVLQLLQQQQERNQQSDEPVQS